ncbi:MAG: Trk system potassium transporter TrkA [Proteobacteria bacterium]|nr:Trk system potassium transporter TrkA [Pseudomonadota bacterium]
MKVIICGAGIIGSGIAKYLAREQIDVTVIDFSEELLCTISDSLDIQTLCGAPTHFDILEKAGASNAQLIIAVTNQDEINILICQIAHTLFKIPLKIAYLKDAIYFDSKWDIFGPNRIPIDILISPEREIARTIAQTIDVPGAFDLIPLADRKVNVVGVRCGLQCPVTYSPLRQLNNLFPELEITVLAILRDDQIFIPKPDDEMIPGDDVYFIANQSHVMRAMQAFGYDQKVSRNILILGAGKIGMQLAQELEENSSDTIIKLIELNKAAATAVAQHLKRSTILCGDALNTQILIEANIAQTESVIAVTNDNEVNILASLLAKRNGARQAITLINNPAYSTLVRPLGIDAIISPQDITISSILHHVRQGRIRSIYTVLQGMGELIEAEVLENSPLMGNSIQALNDPNKFIIGAVIRDNEIMMANESLIFRQGDLVILFAKSNAVREAENLFLNQGKY